MSINVKAHKAEYRFPRKDGSGGVMVSIYHHKGSSRSYGAYSATAYDYDDMGGGVTRFAPFKGARLAVQKVERYSAKTFTAFAEEVMAGFPANVPANSKVAAALAEVDLT